MHVLKCNWSCGHQVISSRLSGFLPHKDRTSENINDKDNDFYNMFHLWSFYIKVNFEGKIGLYFQLGQEFTAITTYYEKEFFQEMSSLNNLQPTMTSRVTDHVPEIVNFIKSITSKGHGYKSSDGKPVDFSSYIRTSLW